MPNLLRSWLSITTDLGVLGGQIGIALGLGDHTDAVLSLTRSAGLGVAALVCALLVLAVLRGRLHPVAGVAYGFGAVFLAGPVLHPWYLLWLMVPLAASVTEPRVRGAAVAICAAVALLVPPTGNDFTFRAYQLPMAIFAALAVAVVPLLAARGNIPRSRPGARTGPSSRIRPGRPIGPGRPGPGSRRSPNGRSPRRRPPERALPRPHP